jgi:hypothetical protein
VILCTVCTVHKETRSTGSLVEPQNQGQWFLLVWPQYRWLQVFRFGALKPAATVGDLSLKINATISYFRPQNQTGYNLSVVPQYRREDEDGVGYASRSSGLLTWKQVKLGFPNLASRLAEARCRWCTWHHRGGCLEMKLKMDMSMQRTASDSSTPTLPFLFY